MTLFTDPAIFLPVLLFAGALLYTSVGHAGASAYLAAMALMNVAPATMRPTALVLNIAVASFSSFRFWRAGLIDFRLLGTLLIGSLPLAFIGGGITLPFAYYRAIVGAVLIAGAVRLLWPAGDALPGNASSVARPHPAIAAVTGAFVGLLSGLTGTGGGIFLSPIMIFSRWIEVRRASGVAVTFILANSIAGLAGNYRSVGNLPPELPVYLGAVMAGALVGTSLGVRWLAIPGILKALGLVLVIAGAKLIFS